MSEVAKNEMQEISYKNPEFLRKFVTARGKISARSRNGLNAREQRELARNVKRARHLALLPFA